MKMKILKVRNPTGAFFVAWNEADVLDTREGVARGRCKPVRGRAPHLQQRSSPSPARSRILELPPPGVLIGITALGTQRREQQTIHRRCSLRKNTKGCAMSKRHQESGHSSDPHTDDLRDWQIIGAVVIASSLLVWGSIVALYGGS